MQPLQAGDRVYINGGWLVIERREPTTESAWIWFTDGTRWMECWIEADENKIERNMENV